MTPNKTVFWVTAIAVAFWLFIVIVVVVGSCDVAPSPTSITRTFEPNDTIEIRKITIDGVSVITVTIKDGE